MPTKRIRFIPSFAGAADALESRLVLSTMNPTLGVPVAQGSANTSTATARGVATHTSLTAVSGTLSQPVALSVTVRGPAAAGAPQGAVNILDHGQVVATLPLNASTSSNPHFATSTAIGTYATPPGGSADFFGKHSLTAQYVPSAGFAASSVTIPYNVVQPTYTPLASGVKIATVVPGSGPAIQSGQTATVMYTGYLAKTGKIFDGSIKDGGTPFSYTLGSGAVIPGFDAGTVGMQVGETRIVRIPPGQGYGSVTNGPIPANSTLIFVLTLESIS
jgi:hypothetical protein